MKKNPVSFNTDSEKLEKLKGKIILIKYGGNAMTNPQTKEDVVNDLVYLVEKGVRPVVVHGGGIVIKKLLEEVGIESEFVEGHRKTDARAMEYVEMALSGNVNSELVKRLNSAGIPSVGISGKDANTVIATKRLHSVTVDGKTENVDLGHVGNVDRINTGLIKTLLDSGYLPVISPVASGDDLLDYNINADMFAGHLAGALKAESYVALTNVDGILRDVKDESSLINTIDENRMKAMIGTEIQGGMIPKIESCLIALENGAREAHIINGTKKHTILKQLLGTEMPGTVITKNE